MTATNRAKQVGWVAGLQWIILKAWLPRARSWVLLNVLALARFTP